MNKNTCISSLFVAGLAFSSHTLATEYVFDKAHTNVQFAVNHNGISNFIGQFQEFDGQFNIDEKNLTASEFQVSIRTASVDTDVKALDDHLKNADFFDVEKHPEMTFKSGKITQVSTDKYEIQGELTMLGKTLPLTLDARLNFQGRHPLASYYEQYDTEYLGFSASATLNRSDYGMATYGPMLADQVKITLETELKRTK